MYNKFGQKEGVSDLALQPCVIRNDALHLLEVELMGFRYMPYTYAVSLVHPGTGMQPRTRLVNLSPQTTLHLLTWLEQWKPLLQQLVNNERE